MRRERMGIIAAWLLVVTLVMGAVKGFERTLRDGQQVLLELAPVDPRSLMQGDYMALRFAVDDHLSGRDQPLPAFAYLHVGAGNRAVLAGTGDRISAEPGVVSMRIRQGDRGMTVGPNAFFFQEGTAPLYQQARWGGFRVAGNGTALLTALYDENLQLLGSNRR